MPLLQCCDAVIHFVHDGKNLKNADMKRAYSICLEAKLKPKIVSGEESSIVPPALNVVFVLEEFAGNVFKTLSSSDSLCRVVGPKCLSYCIENEVSIPENNSSVFSMAMKGLVITSSRLTISQKQEISSLIGYMGGVYTDQMTSATTHLVCDEGKSPKCWSAVEHKIPIMRTDWVKAVWEATKSRDVTASHEEFAAYRLSPFKGMVICCSNLPPAVKNKVQQAVNAHGGVYSTALEQNKTAALIIGEADGKKFQAAQLWSIPCLTTAWVFDSADQGIPLPTRNYLINARPKCSTPTNELTSFMSEDVSCIPFGNVSVNKTIDETSSTMASIASFACQPKNVVRPQPTKPDLEYKKLVNDINLAEAAAAGLFLDGCKVYLSGFSGQDLDKMKKLVNKSGATLFPEINDRLTHVILGDFLPEHVKEIEKLSQKPCIVSVGWILASVRLKTAAPTDPYLCFKPTVSKTGTTNKVSPPSPLSSKGLSLLKSDATADSPKPTDGNSASTKAFVKARVQRRITPDELDDGECAVPKPEVCVQEKTSSDTKTPPRVPSPTKPAETPHLQTDETEMSTESSSVIIGPFFKDFVFLVIGFADPTKIVESINAVGGKVESCNFQGIADYAVVPLDGVSTQLTATEIVTPLWVEDCYDQNKVVPVEYYHQPVSLKTAATPLEGCVICVSGYVGKERTFMFHLADSLGAVVQESFSRKDCPRKNVRKSTHLICKTASGSKYNAAIQWGIPVVNESWLIACVSSGTRPPVVLHQFNDHGEPPVTPSNPAILRVKAAEPVNAISCVDSTPVRPTDTAKVIDRGTGSKAKELSTDSFVKPSTTPEWNSSSRRIVQEETVCTMPSPAPDEGVQAAKGNASLNSLGDDLSAFDGFCTPNNVRPRTSVIGSAGKSPFHVDTPSTPYGRIFMKEGENPSPATRKKWKKYIESLPDMHGSMADSPEVQEFRKRRPSTPLSVIMKQVWVKFGKAEIEGIDPSGDLLPNGPFGEWAHENTYNKPKDCEKQSAPLDNSNQDNPDMSAQDINEKMSILKSRLDSVLTSSQQKAAEEDNVTPQSSTHREPAVTSGSKPKANEWCTPKNTDARSSHAEILWDFGKPVVTVPSHNPAKKLRLSDAESDRSIDEQMTKFFEKEESAPKESKRIFTFSQVQAQTREKFESIVKNLGGEVYSSSSFDPKITHLVVDRILRSEKYLCAVASGKWVLHSSYLTQCYQSRMFLPEEDYEWGNERSRDRLPSLQPGTSEWNLAHASHKWRVRRTDLGQPDSFRQFKAVILTSPTKLPQFVRLLQAGNATVLPKEQILEATHVFWDEDKVPLPVEKALLKAKKIPLLQLVYLGDYLAKSPPPDLNEYVIR